jgi:hypothetical protein
MASARDPLCPQGRRGPIAQSGSTIWTSHNWHHDGDCGGRLLNGTARGRILRDNEIKFEMDQVAR